VDLSRYAQSQGRGLRTTLTESLCLVADTSLPSGRVIRELEAVIAQRGLPRQCVSDNGPEFAGLAMLGWAQTLHLDWHYIVAREERPSC
jgi:hypothetical protein